MVAPYYNLLFAVIVILLFIKLFRIEKSKKMYITPWQLLLVSLLLFLFEEGLTIVKNAMIFTYPSSINALIEMVIISCFIYMLLLQKKYNLRFRK